MPRMPACADLAAVAQGPRQHHPPRVGPSWPPLLPKAAPVAPHKRHQPEAAMVPAPTAGSVAARPTVVQQRCSSAEASAGTPQRPGAADPPARPGACTPRDLLCRCSASRPRRRPDLPTRPAGGPGPPAQSASEHEAARARPPCPCIAPQAPAPVHPDPPVSAAPRPRPAAAAPGPCAAAPAAPRGCRYRSPPPVRSLVPAPHVEAHPRRRPGSPPACPGPPAQRQRACGAPSAPRPPSVCGPARGPSLQTAASHCRAGQHRCLARQPGRAAGGARYVASFA
mmetsp:Transcript_90963/g.253154  ORF Transcript_90963/g.253154 Transcript_90963/m.253154 type:complete len:282 (+) Transcript_90963:2268-3113(+)